MKLTPRVLVIGGGATGTGIARDLALRGIPCLLVEKRDINAGASGGNHGLLHSGARYVASDGEAAVECHEEGAILRMVAPQCIEDTGGLFVAVEGDDETYVSNFPAMCDRSHIPHRELDVAEARLLEPELSDRLIAAYAVRDGAIDPFMLSLDNIAHAVSLGSSVRRNARVSGFELDGNRIVRVTCTDDVTGKTFTIEPELVINAAGAWAGLVAKQAGASIDILYSAGSLIITQDRITRRVINRLRKAADADILVPGGTVSILGTTSVTVDHPDHYKPTVEEVDRQVEEGMAMVPCLETTRYIRAYAGVRPLVLSGEGGDGRNVSRGFSLIDHAADDVDNFITITGGKLTTYRLMAEKTVDMACEKLGVDAPCTTRTEPLPATSSGRWTEPGSAPRSWLDKRVESDVVLCECEMISRSVIDDIIDTAGNMEIENMRGESMLTATGLRSRLGKGPCQGAFCGLRTTAHLYDRGIMTGDSGVEEARQFIERRWRGLHPVLWGLPQAQADLQEALYCGMLDLELEELS